MKTPWKSGVASFLLLLISLAAPYAVFGTSLITKLVPGKPTEVDLLLCMLFLAATLAGIIGGIGGMLLPLGTYQDAAGHLHRKDNVFGNMIKGAFKPNTGYCTLSFAMGFWTIVSIFAVASVCTILLWFASGVPILLAYAYALIAAYIVPILIVIGAVVALVSLDVAATERMWSEEAGTSGMIFTLCAAVILFLIWLGWIDGSWISAAWSGLFSGSWIRSMAHGAVNLTSNVAAWFATPDGMKLGGAALFIGFVSVVYRLVSRTKVYRQEICPRTPEWKL